MVSIDFGNEPDDTGLFWMFIGIVLLIGLLHYLNN